MKVLGVHDKKGRIRSFVVPAPVASGTLELEPDRGLFVSEFDVPGIRRTLKRPEVYLQRLSNILRSYRVERGRKRVRLVRR